jgi:hypothetical protein
MFDLFLIACVNGAICEYVQVPALYASEQTCEMQAALIAGTIQGRHDASGDLTYRFDCNYRAADGKEPPVIFFDPRPS